MRINLFHSKAKRHAIERDVTIEKILKDYNDQKAFFSLTFHDYYAVRNYATTGYKKISGDTNEAKWMKLAFYKIAVRQFDDPNDGLSFEYSWTR